MNSSVALGMTNITHLYATNTSVLQVLEEFGNTCSKRVKTVPRFITFFQKYNHSYRQNIAERKA
jgi:hypothetical protein